MDYKIAVLPGDGIGPEVTNESVKVLNAIGDRFGHTFSYEHGAVGGNAIDDYGNALPDSTLRTAKAADAVLFGAVGGPKWDDPRAKTRPEDGLLAIRQGLDLFANLRPVQVVPQLIDASTLKPSVLEGVDFVVVRELTGGLYYGKPKKRWSNSRGRRGVDTMYYSEEFISRVLRVGFELARMRRKKLTSVDKANVLESSRLWREIAMEMGQEYPDVELEHVLVDTAAMQLVRQPSRFDVMVAENTFGDILTDEAAVLSGSMGMLPSASLAGVPEAGGRAFGLYEPIHGTAPDIAGQGIANPIASILSTAMLLRYSLGLDEAAALVEDAVSRALADGYRSGDIASPGDSIVGTTQMGDIIVSLLG
ncbi:MAG: 3-isopropylmalate dehydrogenase [Chloroflexota bacterium]|nr:3-isopropylmalate dehydrogenase [Chloroflexota bacterium]MDE2968487.1 3-isopropylmalate dehydrogenase [Chloroflexota bacterium]